MTKRFALIGAAGYVAPKHMKAIKDVEGELVTAYDPHDSVGILDSYFPKVQFFTDEDDFYAYMLLMKKLGAPIDYLSICSPNYTHIHHITRALLQGLNVICEKPLVLNLGELLEIQNYEQESGKKVNTILQLRLLPNVEKARTLYQDSGKIHKVNIEYVTPRGQWYDVSWKGDTKKSGGVATNIGVHFFDLLYHLFGEAKSHGTNMVANNRVLGVSRYERAEVNWFLSTDRSDLSDGETVRRKITIDGNTFDLSPGFLDLHTKSYEEILAGRGFGVEDVRSSIEAIETIRSGGLTYERLC